MNTFFQNSISQAFDEAEVEEESTIEEIEEVVETASITTYTEGLTLPELDEDCTHHFVIPTRGVKTIGMCRICGGGKKFNNIPSQEGE